MILARIMPARVRFHFRNLACPQCDHVHEVWSPPMALDDLFRRLHSDDTLLARSALPSSRGNPQRNDNAERLKAGVEATEKRAAEQRKTDMKKIADDFEGAVAGRARGAGQLDRRTDCNRYGRCCGICSHAPERGCRCLFQPGQPAARFNPRGRPRRWSPPCSVRRRLFLSYSLSLPILWEVGLSQAFRTSAQHHGIYQHRVIVGWEGD